MPHKLLKLLISLFLIFVARLVNCTELEQQVLVSSEIIESSKVWSYDVNDYDNDGHLDFLMAGHDSNDRIWLKNRDNVYLPDEFIFPSGTDRHACDSADINKDGWIDVFCTVGAGKGGERGSNELYINSELGFKQVFNHGAEDSVGSGRNVAFLNINGDGFKDLLVTNRAWTRQNHQEKSINRVFINDAKWGFKEDPLHPLKGNHGFSCLAVSDWDNDGLDDVALCGNIAQVEDGFYLSSKGYVNDMPQLLLGDKNNKRAKWNAAYPFHYNKDNLQDLLIIRNGRLVVYVNNGSKQLWTEKSLFHSENYLADIALGDINGDGIEDIYLALRKSIKCDFGKNVPDKVLIGPTFNRVVAVKNELGCVNSVLWLDSGIVVRTNATHSSVGDIEILRFDK